MGKKDDKERFQDVEYHGSPRRESFLCKYALTMFFAIGFGMACGLVGYYVGQSNSQNVDVIDSGEPTSLPEPQPGDYYVGIGKYDVTGPVAQVNMMGYAVPSQIAHGLHMRLYSRAFIFSDLAQSKRSVFVSIDSGMMTQLVKLEVVKKLKEKYGDMYDEKNVVLSGTHSHSGPAGFFQFLLFEVTSLGFIKQSTDSFVDGIVKSIDIAHSNMQESIVYMYSGDVDEANINRSPSAYTHNPEHERSKYTHNTEQEMVLLKITSTSGADRGLITWYPVHGTCMNNTNELISSDNKGRASTLYENEMKHEGMPDYVAAFAQANLGDVSPNTKGPICIDTGEACDYEQSTCGNPPSVSNCIAFGPGDDMFESTDIIGTRQYQAAKRILSSAPALRLQGPLNFAHQFVDMTKEEVTLADGSKATTCKSAMGYSFAAGTTDGPGAPFFHQSQLEGTPLWELATKLIGKIVCKTEPTQADFDCHKPKPVLLPTGFMDIPYAWHPSIVDVQLIRVGPLIISAVPGEFTTMAGRRLKDAVKAEAIKMGMANNSKVVIAGLSNVYTHYITTLEEFGAQRYEGGSTIYGPHTHAAYVARFTNLVENLVKGTAADPGPMPENILESQIELLPAPRPDRVPEGNDYGDVITNANELYRGGEKVSVKFYGANPRHDMRLGSTYLEVQRFDQDNGDWEASFTDADWETKFKWEKMDNNNVTKKLTMIDGLFNLIAKVIGYRINLDRMEELMKTDEFSMKDLKTDENMEYAESRNNLIAKLEAKGILTKEDKRPILEYPTTDESHVTIEWDIPKGQVPGTYRIVYNGEHMSNDGGEVTVTSFKGMSREFQVQS
ncbi:putative neutral ceramidase C isoform X2 [Styela clava]